MIYTLTLNPAIDCYVYEQLRNDGIIKVGKQRFEIGGKGINVSLALKRLGVESRPITILGGFTGQYIKTGLKELGLEPLIIKSSRNTRLNLKVYGGANESEYNVLSEVTDKEVKRVKKILDTLLPTDLLIISGSGSLDHYRYLLASLKCPFVLDCDGHILKHLISYKPLIVKPNANELKMISEDRREALDILLSGAEIVLNTLGSSGSLVKTKEDVIRISTLNSDVVTTVGCGDTYLAAFIKYYLDGNTLEACANFASKAAFFRAKHGVFPTIDDLS